MLSAPLTFTHDGYLHHGDKRFIPVGVNYWPASCGTEMWSQWPEAEIRRDLDRMARLGLNSLRFFLRWDAFEPEPGKWNSLALERLDHFLGWCREAGLYAQPTLFVGWMSGGIFWPEWKAGRNLFSDPELRLRSAGYARKIAEICRPHHGGLMGFDLGNELCCLAESRAAAPRDIAAWCGAVTSAIHEAFPESWSMAGNEQSQINSDCGWRLDDQPGTSCLSMHAYPVPGWHPISFDGMSDPLARSFLPFYVKVARAFGPVMVQEFGTVLTLSPERQRDYLAEVMQKCWEAGANGFLWWCWSDFSCSHYPYNKSSMEKELGLVDIEGNVKPGPDALLEMGRRLSESPSPRRGEAEVGLYWPRYYYARDCPENPGNTPEGCAPRLILAHYLTERAGWPVDVLRHDALARSSAKVLVIAGTYLTVQEYHQLQAWVEKGGCVLWHGPNPHSMGPDFQRLAGFTAVDYRLPRPVTLHACGKIWRMSRFPMETRVDVKLTGGKVIHAAGDVPLVIAHRLGKGCVVTALPDVEGSALDEAGDPERRDGWSFWYGGMIQECLKLGQISTETGSPDQP